MEQRLRKFEMHACLGRGGFGEVYRATMTSPGGVRTTVALKVLRDDLKVEEQAVRRLRDEARLLGALDHPSIVKVHDLTRVDGRYALVCEFVDGQDLEGCLSFGPGVPLKVLIEVVSHVAMALDSAWNAKSPLTGEPLQLVHRDIKPMNIRIGRHGNVKLLDFGVARAANVEREAHTHPDAVVGTYRYLSPESLGSGRRNNPAVDMFALGCTLFRALMGEHLYAKMPIAEQMALAATVERHNRFLESRLDALPGITPDPAKALLRDMLAFDPGLRPSAETVAARCDGVLDDLTGLDLRRWCQVRTWPPEGGAKGPLVGMDLTESPLEQSIDKAVESFEDPTVDLAAPTKPYSREIPPAVAAEMSAEETEGSLASAFAAVFGFTFVVTVGVVGLGVMIAGWYFLF